MGRSKHNRISVGNMSPGAPRLDMSVLARASLEVSRGVNMLVDTEVERLVQSVFTSLTDRELLEVRARIRNVIMEIFRGEPFKHTIEDQAAVLIDVIITKSIAQLEPEIELAVLKNLTEHFDKIVNATIHKALNEAIVEVREKFVAKLKGGV